MHSLHKGGYNMDFQGMDEKKIEFIKSFAGKEKPSNIKDAMPFLLANMNIRF